MNLLHFGTSMLNSFRRWQLEKAQPQNHRLHDSEVAALS